MPIVVAINKMDKEDAQPDRVKQQLAEHGLQPVDWGGKIEMVPVSARTGDGIDELLETVLLEADIRDLKANKNRRAHGVVIESALDRGRGAVATVLVQNGTLRVGDVVVVGGTFGKVRALIDDKGKQVKKAGPSIPVEIMGFSDVPSAGDTLMVVSDERVAREAAAKRSSRRRDVRIAASSGPRVSLETFMQMPADGGQKIAQPHPQGRRSRLGRSAALARRVALDDEVDIRVIHAGVGAITPNDVNLAARFERRVDRVQHSSRRNGQASGAEPKRSICASIRSSTMWRTISSKAMIGMLTPKFREVVLGSRRSARGLQGLQGRHDRRLLRAIRQAHAQREGPRHTR